jgi:hypothetical protein
MPYPYDQKASASPSPLDDFSKHTTSVFLEMFGSLAKIQTVLALFSYNNSNSWSIRDSSLLVSVFLCLCHCAKLWLFSTSKKDLIYVCLSLAEIHFW